MKLENEKVAGGRWGQEVIETDLIHLYLFSPEPLSNKNIINHSITSENPYLNSEEFVHPLFYFLSGQSGQKKMDIVKLSSNSWQLIKERWIYVQIVKQID